MDDARSGPRGVEEQLRAGRPRFDGVLDDLRKRVLAGLASQGARTIGRYRLGRPIGSGAFGTVHAALDPELQREVAIKLFAAGTPQQHARVLREARMLATVSSPNVVHVFEVGVDAVTDAPYLVMELVRGPTLRAHLAAAPRPWREVVTIVLAAARGLAAAHRQGVIHRDFKPDNVILASDGRPRVIDFGLARVAGDESAETGSVSHASGDVSMSLTPTGHTVGTPAYMAPEMFGGPCTPLSDQYSLCVTFYEGLFGTRPFDVLTTNELVARIRGEDPPPPRERGGVPRGVVAVVMRGLQRDPERRHADLDAFVVALERATGSRRATAAKWLGAGAFGSALLVGQLDAGAKPCDAAGAAWDELVAIDDAFAAEQAHYAARGRAVVTELCAADADGMTTAQLHCLERRLDDVAAVRRVLGDIDLEARGELADPFAKLPPPEDCVAPPEVERTVAVVEDPVVLARLERDASHLRALMATSSPSEGLALSPGLLAEARALGYPPIIAELAHAHARLLLLASQYRESADAFEELYHVAIAMRLDRDAARAASDLLRVHSEFLGDLPTARRWAEHADAAFGRIGARPEDYSIYVDGMGSLLDREGDLEGGASLLRRAIERAAARGDARDGPTGGLHNRLGVVLIGLERPDEAIEAFEIAASIFAETNGPDSAPRASALGNLGLALGMLGRHEEALDHHREALAIRQTLLDEDHIDLGASLGNMAEVLERLGRRDEALPYIERALALFTRRLGPDHPHIAIGLALRGRILAAGDDDDRRAARRDYTRAIEIHAAAGPRSADSVATLRRAIEALDRGSAR
jgi:tetratricopeptide (TPR) repeat protein